jgi:hypothetical protein
MDSRGQITRRTALRQAGVLAAAVAGEQGTDRGEGDDRPRPSFGK